MSFFTGLKHAFGLTDDGEEPDDELDYYDTSRTPYVNPFKKKKTPREDVDDSAAPADKADSAPVEAPKPEEQLPDAMLDDIVEIINGSLSPLIKGCIDVDAEKKAVYDSLGPQFHGYVDNIREEALRFERARWNSERDGLLLKLKQTNASAGDTAKRLEEMRDKLQSTELQLKAMKERANNLDNKVATLEAEREQFDLENRSLANKLKVMEARGDDNESLSDEVSRLNAIIAEERNKSTQAAEHIAELEKKLSDIPDSTSPQVEQVTAEFKEKMAITNALVNDLRASVAGKNKELTELQNKLQSTTDEVEALRVQLEEANSSLEVADEVKQKIDMVEEFKVKKNKEIAELKAQISDLKAKKDVENEELKAKIKIIDGEKMKLTSQINEMLNKEQSSAAVRNKRDVDTANRIDDLKQQVASAVQLSEKYKSQLDALTKSSDDNISEVVKVTEERDRLSAQLKEVQHDLKSKIAQVSALQQSLDEAKSHVAKPNSEDAEPAPAKFAESQEKTSVVQVAEEKTVEEPVNDKSIPGVDAIDDIDWLMPTPPSKPKPEPEPEPPKPVSDDGQMSLF
jgi:chromosome segregation ATPase